MRILLGTPVHMCKDYCIERWVENVSEIASPFDFFVVDNSPGLGFAEKVRKLCASYKVKKYEVKHLEIDQALGTDFRIETSQEIIRRKVIADRYDAWFSLECDQLVTPDALGKLVRILELGNFMMVSHNSWMRITPGSYNVDLGCALIKRECLELEGNWFLPDRGGQITTDTADRWQDDKLWFKERVLKAGGNFLNVYGKIDPIYHLSPEKG